MGFQRPMRRSQRSYGAQGSVLPDQESAGRVDHGLESIARSHRPRSPCNQTPVVTERTSGVQKEPDIDAGGQSRVQGRPFDNHGKCHRRQCQGGHPSLALWQPRLLFSHSYQGDQIPGVPPGNSISTPCRQLMCPDLEVVRRVVCPVEACACQPSAHLPPAPLSQSGERAQFTRVIRRARWRAHTPGGTFCRQRAFPSTAFQRRIQLRLETHVNLSAGKALCERQASWPGHPRPAPAWAAINTQAKAPRR